MSAARPLFLPGWGNSDSGHWQSLWCNDLAGACRVEQSEWFVVTLSEWEETLEIYVRASAQPVVLVAHSLSCILIAHWAARHDTSSVQSAMLVAPTDVEADGCPEETRCFAPIPLSAPLPFPSVVIASEDDPYVSPARAAFMALCWGSRYINAGKAGHLNVASGHGPWPQGRRILEVLLYGSSEKS